MPSSPTPIKAKNTQHLRRLIASHMRKYGKACDFNHIDVSDITDMQSLFYDIPFNGDISRWDTSKVTSMESMFKKSKFNGDISRWDVSNVTNMEFMFMDSTFNQNISNWNTGNVTSMEFMFTDSVFTGDVSQWNVSKVEDMENMFSHSLFIGKLDNWKLSKKNMGLGGFHAFHNSPLGYMGVINNEYPYDGNTESTFKFIKFKNIGESLNMESYALAEYIFKAMNDISEAITHNEFSDFS